MYFNSEASCLRRMFNWAFSFTKASLKQSRGKHLKRWSFNRRIYVHRAYKTRRNLTLNVTEHWFPLAGCTCFLCGLLWKLLDVDLVSSLPNFELWKNNINRNDWFCAAQRHANKKCIPNVFKMLSARTHECVRITCVRSADAFCVTMFTACRKQNTNHTLM